MTSVAEALPVVLLVVVLVAAYVYDRSRSEPDDVEKARSAYEAGVISLGEYERRVELAEDPEAERIRNEVESVNGVGPSTSADIALYFDSLEELRAADQEDLERIHGIGEETASAITERFKQ